jgi:hypothetical protein
MPPNNGLVEPGPGVSLLRIDLSAGKTYLADFSFIKLYAGLTFSS